MYLLDSETDKISQFLGPESASFLVQKLRNLVILIICPEIDMMFSKRN